MSKYLPYYYAAAAAVGAFFVVDRMHDLNDRRKTADELALINKDRLFYPVFDGVPKELLESVNPILWVLLRFEDSHRSWPHHTTGELSQPYLEVTVASIVRHCGESFNVVLIDDNSFARLLPSWQLDMAQVPAPIKWSTRRLAMAKLLATYGGMSVPVSFFCLRNMRDLYEKGTSGGRMFACEARCQSLSEGDFCPDMAFMGAPKENQSMAELAKVVSRTLSNDFTGQIQFLGEYSNWLRRNAAVNVISAANVGAQTKGGKVVTPASLLGTEFIDFPAHMYGIWVPMEEFEKRATLSWFPQATVDEVLTSNTVLGKFMALSSGFTIGKPRPLPSGWAEWVRFWEVPLYQGQSNMYGLRPNLLPANLPSSDYPGRPID